MFWVGDMLLSSPPVPINPFTTIVKTNSIDGSNFFIMEGNHALQSHLTVFLVLSTYLYSVVLTSLPVDQTM